MRIEPGGRGYATDHHLESLRLRRKVMPFETAIVYGLCSSGTTTSMARVSSRGRAELDPAGRYLESLRCFCTRRRVSGETSARSLSTFDTVATETPAASAISASVVRPFGTVASGTKVSATRTPELSVTVMCAPKAGANPALDTIPDRSILNQCLSTFRNFSETRSQPITSTWKVWPWSPAVAISTRVYSCACRHALAVAGLHYKTGPRSLTSLSEQRRPRRTKGSDEETETLRRGHGFGHWSTSMRD